MHSKKILLVVSLITLQARATSLELEVTSGSQTKTTALYGSGDFNPANKAKPETVYDWNLSFDRTRTDVTNVSGEGIVDNTTDVSAGLGLETTEHFRAGFSLNSSNTPEENLKSTGTTFSLGYTYNFAPSKTKKTPNLKPVMTAGEPTDTQISNEDADGEDFDPYIALDFNFGNSNYIQTFDSKVQRRLRGPVVPVSGSNSIGQRSNAAILKIKPVYWTRLKASYTKYSYNKDVTDFVQYLDTHNVIGGLSGGFSNALAGFYDNTVTFGISFFPHPDWEFAVERSTSKVVLDESIVNTDRLNIYWDFREAWRLGLGASSSKYNTAGSEASNLTTASLGFDF